MSLESASACICIRALSSRYTLRPTARGRLSPTVTEPCPRISAAGFAPSVFASDAPRAEPRTSRSGPRLPLRAPAAEQRGHVPQRAHRHAGAAERHDRGRMVVHDREHIGPRLVDLAVDETLGHRFPAARIERVAVEVVLEDVLGLHAL